MSTSNRRLTFRVNQIATRTRSIALDRYRAEYLPLLRRSYDLFLELQQQAGRQLFVRTGGACLLGEEGGGEQRREVEEGGRGWRTGGVEGGCSVEERVVWRVEGSRGCEDSPCEGEGGEHGTVQAALQRRPNLHLSQLPTTFSSPAANGLTCGLQGLGLG
ncbi:hypothetical protein HaLaN_11786 [Haematococcus lacustris]|uniref:Uncharacterized protein n=1 Tax=Haematococcus lacustris TaxID=44745 RepID=A0A699Z9N4_HAELA|nr:hypothetical protein HaLaN_11786 [Haematococcus lacustris]